MTAVTRYRTSRLLLVMAALTCGLAAEAEEAASGVNGGGAEACLTCHGAGGSELAPILEGQNADYLKAQIARFRDHARESFPMDALTQGLDDAAVGRLSDELSKRPWTALAAAPSQTMSTQPLPDLESCAECHGERLRGQGAVPRLAGQRAAYLHMQLEAIADGRRPHPFAEDSTPHWTGRALREAAQTVQAMGSD